MTKLELLSPAKNYEFGVAAINCGADAVYIGAPRFGARAAVGNTIEEIERLISYAHKFNAKVYVTLNTLLFDNELEQARKIAVGVYNAGADALIIQDMAFMEMDLPPVPLFASTQTHNYSWQKVLFLEKVGIQRVILARELSIPEITEIRSRTTVELESFVHGAICVCYSGQCYLSQALMNRSGNRGQCAQPCRWQYSLTDCNGKEIVRNKHLISPKDLNLQLFIPQMVQAGVTSFKIEGRLKDISYLKNITASYRRQLDDFIDNSNGNYVKASSGKSQTTWMPDVNRTFNRGYTNYFINGRQPNMASFNTPKSYGTLVGEVYKVTHNSIILTQAEKINNGDGLCYITDEGQMQGFRVNKAQDSSIYPAEMPDINVGTKLYRNHDQEFEKQLSEPDELRKIEVNFEFGETSEGFYLQAVDEDNVSVKCNLLDLKTPAANYEKARHQLLQQLSKSGNTIFKVNQINIEVSNNYFLQISKINELRRLTLQTLESRRVEKYQRTLVTIEPNNVAFPTKVMDYHGNVLNTKAHQFYSRHGVDKIEAAFEARTDYADKQLMTTRYCLKYELAYCHKNRAYKKGELLNEPLFLESGKGLLRIEFDCLNCEMKIFKVS